MEKAKNYLGKIIPHNLTNTFFHLPQALFWTLYYRWPARRLKIIGVTGTDGKTTTTTLIWHILREAGKKTAMISTTKACLGSRCWETGLHTTTPSAHTIQEFLARAAKEKITHVVLESTSHGLVQHRLFGIRPYLGIITNVTHEHLDYHQTMNRYLQAKSKLLKQSQIAILNRDDWSFSKLKKILPPSKKIITYGIKNKADFTPQNFPFKTNLPGEYNQYNCLAAIAAAKTLNIPTAIIRRAIKNFTPPKGRMEEIRMGQNFRVFVDFAHTPNALKNVLRFLRSQLKKDKHLIVVFGSAGERDKSKRPAMGQFAARFAHLVIITADDPRWEEVEKIGQEIASGCQKEGAQEVKKITPYPWRQLSKKPGFIIIPNRRKAIEAAIKIAQEDDIVALCGKGHEKSLSIKGKEYPWSDIKEAKKALKKFKLKTN